MTMKSEYSTGFSSGSLVKLTASMLIFGTVGIFRRSIPVSSEFLAFSRGILGALFLLGFLGLRKNRKNTRIQPVTRSAFLWLVLSGAAIGVNWILLFEAYRYTTVAVATLCYYMQPTIVILLSPLLFRERLTAKKLVCAFLAILGLVLLSGVTIPGVTIPGLTIPGAAAAAGSAGDPRGILYGLGAAALYAFVVILNKLLPPLDAVVKTMIQLFSAPLRLALKVLLNTLLGFAALFLINLTSGLTGLTLGLNLFNALTIGVLGIPGLALLVLLKLVFV